MTPNNATPEVLEIAKIHLEGNVIPHTWYQHIKGPTGKPDVEAIIILSEIVYWYRPEYVRDEQTGQIIGVKKRFKADALQKSKKALAEQFGFAERKVKDCLALLEKLGLITRDYRTIETQDGVLCSNVLYIKVHPEKIKEISFKNVIPMAEICHTPPTNSAIPLVENCHTYTEITDKKKKKKKKSSIPSIEFDYESNQFIHIEQSDIAEWKELYPSVDIQRELAKMRQWLMDPNNPERDGNRTFITNWLNRAFKEAAKTPKKPQSKESQKPKDDTPFMPYNSSIAYGILYRDGEEAYIEYLRESTDQKYYQNFINGIYENEYLQFCKERAQ